MVSQSSIEKWIKVLDIVEGSNDTPPMRLTRKAIASGAPASKARNMFQIVVGALTSPFTEVWAVAAPTEPDLLSILQPIADSVASFDFANDLIAQLDRYLDVVAEAKEALHALAAGPRTAEEIISDLQQTLKITLLVAGTSHMGPMKLIDGHIAERVRAINRGETPAPAYFDFATSTITKSPSNSTVSLAEFAVVVDGRVPPSTWNEALGPDAADQPLLMKQFASQAIVDFFTEWEEYYRPALAAALGCSEDDLRIDYFGDLRNMRQDYVHNRGRCRNSVRNKVLKWFTKGQVMIPSIANYLEMLTAFPAEQLRVKPALYVPDRKPVKANATASLVVEFERVADADGLSKDAAIDQALTEWLAAHRPPE